MQDKSGTRPDLSFEREHRQHGRLCIGVDEVGRGCLAGPVVTAAVMLPDFVYGPAIADAQCSDAWWSRLNDSKRVSPKERKELSELLWKHAEVQVAWCVAEEIDRWNILCASMIAMRQAAMPFAGRASAVLVDGHISPFEPRYRCGPGYAHKLGFTHVELLVKGDQRSMSIAAASIVAKVYRDEWMAELDRIFPGYAFADHKGYSTPSHKQALKKLGPCVLHRRSFEPVRSLVSRT